MLKEEGEPPSGRTSCGDARKNHASAVARNGLGLNRQLTGPAIGRGKGWTPAPPHSPADSPPPHRRLKASLLVRAERTRRASRLRQPLRSGHGSGRISAHRRRLPRPGCTQRCVRTSPPPNGRPDEPPHPWVLRRTMA